MKQIFYRLPINFDSVFDETAPGMPVCSELESIDQYIEMIITTCPGEHKFNKNFGCGIWDMDFELVVSRKQWEEDFTARILKAVQSFERRLKDVTVAIRVMEAAKEDLAMKTTAIKKKVHVFVNGKLVSSNESCGFNYILYLGPLTTE
ncbi:MAG: GPW/gp25 family protein [Prevotellaceae bacterium]|jgi:phage baseplate assembly protein W|nr:GPW/gp25 family protein [Prevotellaceae bacterium]